MMKKFILYLFAIVWSLFNPILTIPNYIICKKTKLKTALFLSPILSLIIYLPFRIFLRKEVYGNIDVMWILVCAITTIIFSIIQVLVFNSILVRETKTEASK